jgi:hypothetical protein
MRGKKYADHIEALCKQHGIEHVVDDGAPAGANLERRSIRTPRVSGSARYLTALHEVGHIVTLSTDRTDTTLRREERAWRWALENGIEKPSENGARSIYRRLCSYVVRARMNAIKDGNPLGEEVPGPEDEFWSLLGELVPDPARAAYEATKTGAAKRAGH